MWRACFLAIHAGSAYRRPEFRLTRACAAGVYGCPRCIVQCGKRPEAPSHVSPVCDHRGGNAGGQRAWRSAFHRRLKALMLGSIGVVYGDIGTSPLYALREAVACRQRRRGRRHAAGRARRALADPVGADRRRDAQICRHPAARRQPRRGRHAVADGAGAARGEQGRRRDPAARHHLAARCSSATRSSRRHSRCCRRSKASSSSRRLSILMSCR